MKYFAFFIVALVIGIAILFTLDYMNFNVWVITLGLQWVTQYIVPWLILIVLIIIAKK